MKLEEVMKLIDAGYTKEDIQGFLQPAQPEEPKEAPAQAPAAQPDNAVLNELKELRKAVKAMTIVSGAAEKPAEKSVQDILDKLV